jgi:hypothetical protein
MFKLTTLALAVALTSTSAFANSTPIVGNVQSKCTIVTTRTGVYAQPTPDELTTAAADGGRTPIVRVDVSLANYYTAKFVTPNAFSSSPSLTDTVTWTGSVSVSSVSAPAMSDYDTNKITYNNVTEYDLHTAGSTWFEVESSANYGVDKSFPGGNYTAIVAAECIAN